MKLLVSVCLCYCLSMTLSTIHAQHYAKAYLGQMYYQGDLSPTASPFSLSSGHFSTGLGYAYQANKWLRVGGDFYLSKLSGADIDSPNPNRQKRNLSFYSNLYEFDAVVEANLCRLILDTCLYDLEVYYKTGIGVANVNPKTRLDDVEYVLRDYHTEGQGLNGKSQYGTNHVVIPFGLGLRFQLTDRISMGVEAMARWTFTDYLDDVSNGYPDMAELLNAYGEESVYLSYREQKLKPEEYDLVYNKKRGDDSDNDWYSYIGLEFTMRLGKPKAPIHKLDRGLNRERLLPIK